MSAPQGTYEWLCEKAGHASASHANDILAKIKSGEAASRRRYRTQLVIERLTGEPATSFVTPPMQWGIDVEPQARIAYEVATGEIVIEQPFIKHPEIKWCGCSPDGFVGDDGMVQFKCPDTHTHISYLLAGVVPTDYYAQMQFEMWVTRREWSDFVSFDPRVPEHLRLFTVRLHRDGAYLMTLETEVRKFLTEVERDHQKLMERGNGKRLHAA